MNRKALVLIAILAEFAGLYVTVVASQETGMAVQQQTDCSQIQNLNDKAFPEQISPPCSQGAPGPEWLGIILAVVSTFLLAFLALEQGSTTVDTKDGTFGES
ncbi:MAG: hypothetical protein OK455_05240 [Thaumarchaeota archaeon]|nr:hypothetical protein [Nitrososphaerota archaeon]